MATFRDEIDEEVTPLPVQTQEEEPEPEIDEEVSTLDKATDGVMTKLGLIDEETKITANQLRALAQKNAAFKKGQQLIWIRKVVKAGLVIVGVIVAGVIIYIIHGYVTKGKNGVVEAVRRLTGHKNGFK